MKSCPKKIKGTPMFFPWRGEVHDGRFHQQHVQYSPEKKIVSLTVWRPAGGVLQQSWREMKRTEERMWEGLTIVATGIDSFEMRVAENVPFFELSTVYAVREEAKIVFECHYAVEITGYGAAIGAELLSTILGPKRWHEVFA